jgi:hypothetical protein
MERARSQTGVQGPWVVRRREVQDTVPPGRFAPSAGRARPGPPTRSEHGPDTAGLPTAPSNSRPRGTAALSCITFPGEPPWIPRKLRREHVSCRTGYLTVTQIALAGGQRSPFSKDSFEQSAAGEQQRPGL